MSTLWMVVRTDDAGNSFLVKDGLNQTEAEKIIAEFMSKKVHKQHYNLYSYRQESRSDLIKKNRIYV